MFQNLKSDKGQSLDEAYQPAQLKRDGYHTNNQYSKFPPLMSDGRTVYASWQPNADINEQLLKDNNIQSNWQYRKFMTQNGNAIREQMFKDSLNDVGYVPGSIDNHIDFSQSKGLSDLKDQYLTREELQSKMMVPSLTQEQLFHMQKQKQQ